MRVLLKLKWPYVYSIILASLSEASLYSRIPVFNQIVQLSNKFTFPNSNNYIADHSSKANCIQSKNQLHAERNFAR